MTFGVLIAAGVLAYQSTVVSQAVQLGTSASRTVSEAQTSGAPDVIYQVFFSAGDQLLGSPTVAGQFGREVRVEIPDAMRVTMFTEERDQTGRYHTTATMQVFLDNAWQPPKTMSMKSDLAITPSFEHTVEGTPYRFVVMPRRIVPAAN